MLKKTSIILFILLAVALTACQSLFGPRETPFPTLFIPTPDCGSPTLVLGTTTFQIQNLSPAADGALTVPTDTSGMVYWVDGTNTNYVFVFGPTPDNMSLASALVAGTTAKVTLKNCNSTTYSLSAPKQASLNSSTLPDQSAEGITLFFQTDSSGAGTMFNGELTEQQISTFNTPIAGGSEVQAEIGLLETTASPDGKTIKIGVSIYNWGGAAITLSANTISLTQPDGTTLNLMSSEPPLPKELKPTATEKIFFTFPRPASQTATLKVFTVEYDIEGY